jgi:hypothetical protein
MCILNRNFYRSSHIGSALASGPPAPGPRAPSQGQPGPEGPAWASSLADGTRAAGTRTSHARAHARTHAHALHTHTHVRMFAHASTDPHTSKHAHAHALACAGDVGARDVRKRTTLPRHASCSSGSSGGSGASNATRPSHRRRKQLKLQTWRHRRRRRMQSSGRSCASKTSAWVPEVVLGGNEPYEPTRAPSRTCTSQAHTCQTTHTRTIRAYASMRARTIT